MKNTILILTLILLATAICLAGWARTFGGSSADWGKSVIQTREGEYIVAGVTYSFGAGINDAYLIKINTNGDTVWTHTYGGYYEDDASSVLQTDDGGFVFTGRTETTMDSLEDICIVKTDIEGDTIWTHAYGGSENDWGKSIIQTTDGGYVVSGVFEYNSFTHIPSVVCLLRTDANGDTLWMRTYGGSNYDQGMSVVQTIDEGFIVTGYTSSFGAGYTDVYLIKTNVDGDTVWTRTYGGSNSDVGFSVVQTSDGGYIVAGATESFGAGGSDVYLVKTDSDGDTTWTRTYGGGSYDRGYSVAQTSDGGYIVAGVTESFGAGGSDVYLVKADAVGETIWTRTYGGSYNDMGYSVAQTSDGGYIVAGVTAAGDVYLVKTDSLGYTGIEENLPAAKPAAFAISAYPNPFNSACRISAPMNAKVEIFDIEGLKIGELHGGEQVWKPEASVGSGIYLVRARVGEQEITKRVVYLK